ncbi:MAG: hypothetical protein A3E36_04450 [Candidatus Andersenbacteria bacterium RIFCSPHIGHO2_12_FULL_45_11b]|uniref:Uncharacterized protein n=1 Tax=Candidatus Andersenbacteria bacterium RIFCSPHIGHO2_12_FULL_45_11b TaxID=1797282 RepID=A0A1G1XAP1_9BACT|nr:MAG: hypothetical protein A3E36_04450 [Candidatus Andersenbacteria bacterium RIFCSPHIGHO2_12_FULL_45_11b]
MSGIRVNDSGLLVSHRTERFEGAVVNRQSISGILGMKGGDSERWTALLKERLPLFYCPFTNMWIGTGEACHLIWYTEDGQSWQLGFVKIRERVLPPVQEYQVYAFQGGETEEMKAAQQANCEAWRQRLLDYIDLCNGGPAKTVIKRKRRVPAEA